jgi:hypothetical protein
MTRSKASGEAVWRKSSASEGSSQGACVEVTRLGSSLVGIRDSKDSEGPHLSVSPHAFGLLAARVRTGELDR